MKIVVFFLSLVVVVLGLLFLRPFGSLQPRFSELNPENLAVVSDGSKTDEPVGVVLATPSDLMQGELHDDGSPVRSGDEVTQVTPMADLSVSLKVRNFLIQSGIDISPAEQIELVELFQETHLVKSIYEKEIMEVAETDSGDLEIFVSAYPESGAHIRNMFIDELADILSPDTLVTSADTLIDYADRTFYDFGNNPIRYIVKRVGVRDGEEIYRITILSYGPNYIEGQEPIIMSQSHSSIEDMVGGRFDSIYHVLVDG